MNRTASAAGTACLVAGIALAAMAALAVFGNLITMERLITPGDPASTARDIANSEALFRSGIASLIIVVLLDIVVAVALQTVFSSVYPSISTAAMAFRITYAAVFGVAISQLAVAVTVFGDPERMSLAIKSFDTIWQVGLVLFAVHLLLIGYLAYRSGFVARAFGILLVVAGLGYLIDGFGTVLVPGYSISVAQVTFVGEVAFIFWLLIKGRRLSQVPGQHLSYATR